MAIRALRSGGRGEDLVRARELLMLLGVERLEVKDLTGQLRKSPDGMSPTLARAARTRTEDTVSRRELTRLDRAMADARARHASQLAGQRD